MFSHPQYRLSPVRVSDSAAYRWLWSQGSCYWRGKVEINLREVDFWSLEPANSLRHWDVLAKWTRQVACRRKIPPLIVNVTERNTLFIQDGNHRYQAIRICHRNNLKRLRLRVAVIEPIAGYHFVSKCFGGSWTYVLVPSSSETALERPRQIGTPVKELREHAGSAF